MKYAIAEYDTHAEWTEHLNDIGMLDASRVPCVMAETCVAKDDDA
jgi:hypothetical protein